MKRTQLPQASHLWDRQQRRKKRAMRKMRTRMKKWKWRSDNFKKNINRLGAWTPKKKRTVHSSISQCSCSIRTPLSLPSIWLVRFILTPAPAFLQVPIPPNPSYQARSIRHQRYSSTQVTCRGRRLTSISFPAFSLSSTLTLFSIAWIRPRLALLYSEPRLLSTLTALRQNPPTHSCDS